MRGRVRLLYLNFIMAVKSQDDRDEGKWHGLLISDEPKDAISHGLYWRRMGSSTAPSYVHTS